MKFEAYLQESRLQLFGHFLMEQLRGSSATLSPPYPPAELGKDRLKVLVDRLNSCMPDFSMILDLKDWDVQLIDVLGTDWYFAAAFGAKDSLEDLSLALAEVFLEQVAHYDMDYDQHSNAEQFRELVDSEALTFIRDWRRNILEMADPTAGR